MKDERNPLVKLYKDGDSLTVVTTATTPDEFLWSLAEELEIALKAYPLDEEFQLAHLLPRACEVWAKLKGYKADVTERRLIIAGEPNPEGSAELMNDRNNPTIKKVKEALNDVLEELDTHAIAEPSKTLTVQ